MKYGKTERICGMVILLALAAILVPWLMSDPAPRDASPPPSFDIETPVDAPRRDISAPQKPASIAKPTAPEPAAPELGTQGPSVADSAGTGPDKTEADRTDPDRARADAPAAAEPPAGTADDAQNAEASSEAGRRPQSSDTINDPIAALVRQGGRGPEAVESGEWAVQVGSFGQADNVRRLKKRLEDQGFRVYTRARDNDLTTVLAGPYGSAEDGERARALIKQKANQQGLLIRIKD